jgi:hypothetical protein
VIALDSRLLRAVSVRQLCASCAPVTALARRSQAVSSGNGCATADVIANRRERLNHACFGSTRGGGAGIRTQGALARPTVFKSAAWECIWLRKRGFDPASAL